MKINQKPERYVVLHNHTVYGQSEQGWASYNTKLDGQLKVPAANLAIQTASRYNGEIFADYGDGNLIPVQSYQRN